MYKLALSLMVALMAMQASVQAETSWITDLPAAQAQAKKDKKLVFINFTGSDWCGWCKRLQKEVFTTKDWNDYTAKNLVLVEIDFPNQKKQSDALKKANTALQSKHKVDGFPTLVVLDGDGKEVWRKVGYMDGGPKAWIAEMSKLKK